MMSEKGKEKAAGRVPQTRGTEGDAGAANLGTRRARRETDKGDHPIQQSLYRCRSCRPRLITLSRKRCLLLG